MRSERWADAAEVLSRDGALNDATTTQIRLCRNLAALQVHRPDVYRAIADAPENDCYTLIDAKGGLRTVAMTQADGRAISLSDGNDPVGAVRHVSGQLEQTLKLGQPICLAGVGDGYLLDWLAKNPPALPVGRPYAIVMIEPDARLLLACLTLHDYTGEKGPIEQKRIRWYTGPSACDDFKRDSLADLMLPFPTIKVRLGLQSKEIDERVGETMLEANRMKDRFIADYAAYARDLTTEKLAELFSPNPPRKPRVLLMTTRFSTVLQFATRDSADAFRENGWDAHILIEPTPHHALNRIAIAQATAEFKPDVIFQLDHLRHEHGGIFPANVPFVCWIQDHLPNLTRVEAGKSITSRDFVLTNREHVYHKDYAYPLRQCIYLDKATRVPPMPARWEQDGHDFAFVSNCSRDPRELADQLVAKISDPIASRIVRRFCDRTIERYASGESLATMTELREAVAEVEREQGAQLSKLVQMDQLLGAISHPFNDTLYRQQALRWAIDVAREMRLDVGLYGQGWEKNEEFAQNARGYIDYGEQLEQLTRRTKINLQIVPFAATHQRLLDGLIAGGFFLIREHAVNRIPAEFTAFVEANFEASVQTTEHALRVVCPERREDFERLLSGYRRLIDVADPVNRVRSFQERSLAVKLPHLDDVCFSDRESFRRLVERYIHNRDARDTVAHAQRRFVMDRFTYQAHIKRVTDEIRLRISNERSSS
jgi:hypothetical protein